jgi:MFS family permease
MHGQDRQSQRLERNLLALRVLAFFQVFMVIVPVAVPLFGDRGLDIAEVLELQALFGLVVVLGEVPSGYFADVLGRRLALVTGAVFLGIGHTLLVFAHDFATLALFECALGVGVSLISGADVATLYDSQVALGHGEAARRRGLGGLFFARQISEAGAGLAAAAILALGTFEELVLVQMVVGWLPLAVALLVVDPPVERMASGTHLDNLGGVLRALLASGDVLRRTFLVMGIWSLSTFYAVWLLQHHLLEEGTSLSAFGIAWAVLAVIGAVSGRQAAWLEEELGAPRLLALVAMLPVLGYVLYAVVPGTWALLVAPLFWVARGAGFVVLQGALNTRLDSHHRATANSLVGFLFRAVYALTVPLMGAVLREWTLQEVFLLLACFSLAVWLLLVAPLVRSIRAAALAEDLGPVEPVPTSTGAGPAPALAAQAPLEGGE